MNTNPTNNPNPPRRQQPNMDNTDMNTTDKHDPKTSQDKPNAVEIDWTDLSPTELDNTDEQMDLRERVVHLFEDSRAKLQSLSATVREHAAESLSFHSVEEKYSHLQQMIRSFETGMLITLGQGDKPRGRPMLIADVQGHDDTLVLWFVSRRTSQKVEEIESESYASVAFQDGGRYLSVTGRARTVEDKHKIKLLWQSSWDPWFEGGANSADAVLLRVQVQEAEYWDRSGLLRAQVVYNVARALIAGSTKDETDSGNTVTDNREYGRLAFTCG